MEDILLRTSGNVSASVDAFQPETSVVEDQSGARTRVWTPVHPSSENAGDSPDRSPLLGARPFFRRTALASDNPWALGSVAPSGSPPPRDATHTLRPVRLRLVPVHPCSRLRTGPTPRPLRPLLADPGHVRRLPPFLAVRALSSDVPHWGRPQEAEVPLPEN